MFPDVDPNETYLISVVPVYNQRCGPPQSVPARLLQGALMEPVDLTVASVTQTTVSVVWSWQRRIRGRVQGYRAMLRKDLASQHLSPVVSLWPDQQQHTFSNLSSNTEYSLVLLADNNSRSIEHVTTGYNEVPAVGTETLLLLAVTIMIITILSRTVYKSYFLPTISSPRGSTTGQWLMDPNRQQRAERSVLDIEDFQVTDVLGERSLIMVGPKLSSAEDLHEDTSLLPIGHLGVQLSCLKMDVEYVSDSPQTTEQQQLTSLQPPDSVFFSEESREAGNQPLPSRSGWFPQKQEENEPVSVCQTSRHTETPLTGHVYNPDNHCVHQVTSEAECAVNSASLEQTEAASGQTDCPYLTCDMDYIATSC